MADLVVLSSYVIRAAPARLLRQHNVKNAALVFFSVKLDRSMAHLNNLPYHGQKQTGALPDEISGVSGAE